MGIFSSTVFAKSGTNISRHEEVLRVELAVMADHRHVFVHHRIHGAGAIAGEDCAVQNLPKRSVISG
jgi:hypothetical protein